MTFRVDSEVGQLRQAIIHRPGLELSRLTPDNIGALLFDDVHVGDEGQGGARRLRRGPAGQGGARPLLTASLLAETLDLPEGRSFVLDRLCTPEILGPSLVEPRAAPLRGSRRRHLGRVPGGWGPEGRPAPAAPPQPDLGHAAGRRLRAHPAAQPPVPAGQLVLDLRRGDHQPHGHARPPTRDAAHPGHLPLPPDVRRAPTSSPTTATRTGHHQPATVEGGDVHVIGHGAVLIGMGERTTPMAVETVARRPLRRRPGDHGGGHRAAPQSRLHAPRHRR